MAFADISNTLWRERRLLELLLYKLDAGQLLLAADRIRWLPQATREVEAIIAELREVELLRAIEVDAVAHALGLPRGASLRDLARASRPPWPQILDEHRQAFIALTEEIGALAADPCPRRPSPNGSDDTARRSTSGASNDPIESADQLESIAEMRMQEISLEAALAANANVLARSLLDFLR